MAGAFIVVISFEIKAPKINTVTGSRGIITFRKNTRSAVRGLWIGALTLSQALSTYRDAQSRSLEQAWIEGAQECGIQPDELTEDEIVARETFILGQRELAEQFMQDVNAQSKPNGGKLTPLLQRNEMWVNQYESARSQGEALACANEKREWVVGRTEHCRTCLALNGQVRRLSFWTNNVMPRNAPNDRLECRGFRCQCTLQKTDKPLSRGRLPS